MTKSQFDKLPLDQQMAFMNKIYKGEEKFDKESNMPPGFEEIFKGFN
jgi:hypothetical protein